MYDIRGIFDQEFDQSDISKIAKGLAIFFKKKNSTLNEIAIGRDNRASSPLIFRELTQEFLKLGFNILDLGICPTPVVSSMIKSEKAVAGVMITASHNPANYNGFKIYADFGQVWGKEIAEIGSLAREEAVFGDNAINHGKIKHSEYENEVYLSNILNEFAGIGLHNMRFAIDPLGGSSIQTLKKIIKCLKLENALLIDEVSRDIAQPDPTKEANLDLLKKLVIEKKLDFGVAFDGDADRMIAVDDLGRMVDGDQLISIFCQNLLKNCAGKAFVVDVKASDTVKNVVEESGGSCFYSATGNPLVQQEAAVRKAVFCGEASCHFTFFDSGPGVDDGIYAWLRFTKIILSNQLKLSQIIDSLPKTVKTKEICLKYKNEDVAKRCLDGVEQEMLCRGATLTNIDGLKARMSDGWGLIRKSNTQPILSLKFEAKDEQSLKKIKGYFASTLSSFIDEREMEQLFE